MEKIIKIFEIIEKEIYKDQEFNDLINNLIIDIINNKNKDFNSVDELIKSYEYYKTNIFSFFIKYNDIIIIINDNISEPVNSSLNSPNTEKYEKLVYFMLHFLITIKFFEINDKLFNIKLSMILTYYNMITKYKTINMIDFTNNSDKIYNILKYKKLKDIKFNNLHDNVHNKFKNEEVNAIYYEDISFMLNNKKYNFILNYKFIVLLNNIISNFCNFLESINNKNIDKQRKQFENYELIKKNIKEFFYIQ